MLHFEQKCNFLFYFAQNIWSCQIKAVTLHALLKNTL